MQDKLQSIPNTPEVPERRACPRIRVTSLIYIDIGTVNGGIVTSLSESGMAFATAASLRNGKQGNAPLRMRIQFPGIPEAIEANGEIVWTSSSGKEARVRFVELEDKAREQIKSWISDRTSINNLRPDPPQLPKMQLPSSRRAKTPMPRFSFADVASSRVEPDGETAVEDFPEIAGDPGQLPPLETQGVSFAMGSEVVASAFESPAFTEDRTGKARSRANEQTGSTTPDQNLQPPPSLSIPERRQHCRRQILLFTYAVLGEDNGGLVFNLGEGGLALTAAAALQEHHFNKMRVRFPDSEDWIETSGRLAWKSDSGKEVGIEFAGLPEDARARIAEWASQGEPDGDLRSEGEAGTDQSTVQELPSFMEPDEFSEDLRETPASFEEQPFENDEAIEEHHFENGARAFAATTSASALFKTGIKGILERASVRKRVAKIKPPRPRLPDHSDRPGTRVARKALSIAAGVALAVGGWMFFQRSPWNEASGIIAQTLPSPQPLPVAAQKPDVQKTEAGAAEAAADPPVHSNEKDSAQAGIAKPSVPQTDSSVADTSEIAGSSSASLDHTTKEKPRGEQAIADVPHANLPRSSEQSRRPAPPQRSQETKSRQLSASAPISTPGNKRAENKPVETKSAETKPADSKPVQVAQALPTVDLNKARNTLPLTLNSNPPQPAGAPTDLEKEKPPVVSKQPEPPVVPRTPVVSVSFDPYPSIRMPKAESSKKSHQKNQGKSLQMGRLVTRVDPVYPEEAKQQGVEGTVKVHAIFNRDGAVQSVVQISGPPLLVPAAMSAVRQWRYSQTILGGQAMETEEDVTVQFRLANSASKN